jgi:hypothetical protein
MGAILEKEGQGGAIRSRVKLCGVLVRPNAGGVRVFGTALPRELSRSDRRRRSRR